MRSLDCSVFLGMVSNNSLTLSSWLFPLTQRHIPNMTLVKEHATQSATGPSFPFFQVMSVFVSTSEALDPISSSSMTTTPFRKVATVFSNINFSMGLIFLRRFPHCENVVSSSQPVLPLKVKAFDACNKLLKQRHVFEHTHLATRATTDILSRFSR